MTPSRHSLARTLASKPVALPAWGTAEFWAHAAAEGVLPLVVRAVAAAGWAGVPEDLRAPATRRAQDEAAAAALSDRDLRRLLAALASQSIPTLLIKGAALGYTHYSTLADRPRLDVDLFIGRADIGAVHDVFQSIGGEYVPHVSGQYVLSQFHYVTTDSAGCRHAYDVHWRIVNAHRFSRVLTFDEMYRAGATPAPLRPLDVRAPSPVHALLLGCLHRAVHHGGGGPLIWLHDLHLIAEQMTGPEQHEVAPLAAAAGLADIAVDALGEAARNLDGRVTAALVADLLARGGNPAVARRYVERRRTPVGGLMDDLAGLEGWRARAGLVREVLCPPPAYMRTAYAPGSRAPLGVLYLRRIARGAGRWLRRA